MPTISNGREENPTRLTGLGSKGPVAVCNLVLPYQSTGRMLYIKNVFILHDSRIHITNWYQDERDQLITVQVYSPSAQGYLGHQRPNRRPVYLYVGLCYGVKKVPWTRSGKVGLVSACKPSLPFILAPSPSSTVNRGATCTGQPTFL